jgi:hypothetical protein
MDVWQSLACGIANRHLTLEEWQQYAGDEQYESACANRPVEFSSAGRHR